MKKLLHLLAGVTTGVALLSACTTADENVSHEEGLFSFSRINATITDVSDTRTHLQGTDVHWDDNDEIGIFSDTQDVVRYSHQSDNTFSGNEISGTTFYAFYPYSPTFRIGSTHQINVNLASEFDYTPNSYTRQSPMVAKSNNNHFEFRQTTGIIKFSLTGSMHLTSLVLTGSNDEPLAGTGIIDMDEDTPLLVISTGSDTSKSITMNMDVTLDGSQATDFYFIVPPITFTNGFTLQLNGTDGTTGQAVSVTKQSLKTQTISRAMLASFAAFDTDELLQELYEDIEINPAYVAIDWDNTPLLSANAETGEYSFNATSATGSIRQGSVLSIINNNNVDIVIVNSVIQNGATVSITSTPGTLNNIFANTNFTLSTSSEASTRSMAGSRIFYPVKTVYQDKDGNIVIENETQTRALTVKGEHNLAKYDYDISGTVLHSGNHHKLYLEKAKFYAGLDLAVSFTFGEVDKAYKYFTSKPKMAKAELIGNIDIDQMLRLDVFGSEDFFLDPQKIKQNIFKPVGKWFIVADVIPIYVECSGDLYLDGEGSYKYDGSFYTGYSKKAEGSAYVQWEDGAGGSIGHSYESTFDVTYPTIEGYGEIESKVHLFPRINITIDKFTGTFLDLKPYLRTEIKGGFKEELLSSDNDFCAWSIDFFGGFDVAGGVDLKFFDMEMIYTSPDLNVKDLLLYKSPTGLKFLSPSKIVLGQKNSLSFGIYDTEYITNQEVATPLPQLVKFSTKNGNTISSKYGVAKSGEVSIDWYPAEEEDALSATLYDAEGNIIKQVDVKGNGDSEESGGNGTSPGGQHYTRYGDERDILMDLYYATDGVHWTFKTNWGTDLPVNQWYGITSNDVYDEEGNFRPYILGINLENNNLTGSIPLTLKELSSLQSLRLGDNNITNTIDVSGCKTLVNLYCQSNQLTSLDVSGCEALVNLICQSNQLTSLNVSGCEALAWLHCPGNQLTSLDVSGCKALATLNCFGNQLTSLNVSGCEALAYLFCESNQLISLDVSGCTALNRLDCHVNQIEILNVSGCISLSNMECGWNQLTNLDVSECTALTTLDCMSNQLTSLNISGCTSLTELNCMYNQLTSLDVSNCNELISLKCSHNQLISMDISENIVLTTLWCESNNQLSSLNVSKCTALTELFVTNTPQLATLNASGCTSLTELSCGGRNLTDLDVSNCTALISLNCVYSSLKNLDVSSCIALTTLDCSNMKLTSLNVFDCTALERLHCNNNQLISLDISTCTALTELECYNNRLSDLDISNCNSLLSLSISHYNEWKQGVDEKDFILYVNSAQYEYHNSLDKEYQVIIK